MNGLGSSLVWSAVQVSLFCLAGAVAYVLGRRRGPSAGALVAFAAVLLVFAVSLLALSPWPHWWDLSPRTDASAQIAAKDEPAQGLEEPPGSLTVAKSEPGAVSKPVPPHSALPDSKAIWQAAWSGMVEGLRNPTPAQVEQGWRWPGLLACLMLAGMVIGLLRLAVGLTAVRRYRRLSCPIDDSELADLLIVIRAELGCRRPVAIHESAALDAPAVVGWLEPLVLLPETWRSWTEDERRAVLAHEVAHITHGDYVSWILAQLSLIVNFYNPLVHWLVSRLRIEQELAADDCGARLTGGRETYLTILAKMALRLDNRQASWAARPFLPARGTFLRRIEMLRDAKLVGQPPLALASRVLVVGVLAAAALLAAGVRAPFVKASPSSAIAGSEDQPAAARGPLTADFIPPGAVGAIAVRVQELSHLEGVEELAKTFGAEPLFKMLGVGLKDIEELKIALLDLNPNMGSPNIQFSVRSIKALDWLAAFRKAKPNMLEIEYNGAKYCKFAEDRAESAICIYQPDERTLVGAPQARIRDLIQAGGKSARPGWAAGWDKVAGGQAVVMVDVETIAKLLNADLQRNNVNSPVIGMVSPVWDNSKVAFLGVNLGKNLAIQATSESKSEESAQIVRKNLNAIAVFAENGLDAFAKQPELERMPAPDKAMVLHLLAIGKDLLGHIQVSQEGSVVSLQSKTDKFGTNTISSLLAPALRKTRDSAKRMQSANNMKQILLAMHNYHDVNGRFPAAAVVGPDGKTTHSWRVALLPYLEQDALYRAYKMDEPWDSENNRKILEKMPRVFKADPDAATTATSYFALTGPETIFSDKEGTRITAITDGSSNTIMLVEAKEDIPWTKPADLPYDAKKPLPKFGGYSEGGFNAAYADGSVRFIANTIAEVTMRALITKAGGEVIPQ